MRKLRVGKALKNILSKDKVLICNEYRINTGSPLAHPSRRKILELLCRYPCSSLTRVAEFIGVSITTTEWHLDRLTKGGYVTKAKQGELIVSYPINFVHADEIPLLTMMNNENTRKVLARLQANPGIWSGELGRLTSLDRQSVTRAVMKLEKVGLMASVEDGRYKRYYPTNLLHERKKMNHQRMHTFKEQIISHMNKEGLKPKVLRMRTDDFMVSIEVLGNSHTLTLHTDPYSTMFE